MDQLLRRHLEAHREAEIQDAVKFLYQRHMGPGHLISDEDAALQRLRDEWDALDPAAGVPLSEPLGRGLCRLNLAPCRELGISPELVSRMFCLTAGTCEKDPEGLAAALAPENLADLPWPQEEIREYTDRYRESGYPAVSHSSAYRTACHPAYRVVRERYVQWLPVLAEAEKLMRRDGLGILAVDGPCASGKTTLGEDLQQILGCPVVHMDDFYTPFERKTPERLAQPGGNADWERFLAEVLLPLRREGRAEYRVWNCRTGTFDSGTETVGNARLVAVEGSYSLHPRLRDFYDLKVWLEAPLPVREQRLLERGGPECLQMFREKWIPLENSYFSACRVRECCDIRICPPGP